MTSVRISESDPKSEASDTNASHLAPIIINQPKAPASSQIMPPLQNADAKNFNRFTISGGSVLPTIMPNTNMNTRVVSLDASTHPSPNLLTTLRVSDFNKFKLKYVICGEVIYSLVVFPARQKR